MQADSAHHLIENTKSEYKYIGKNVDEVEFFKKNSNNTIINPSFENGSWSYNVQNCDEYDGPVDISQRFSSDSTSGSKSIELSAKNHAACIESNTFKTQDSHYVIEFDHKAIDSNQSIYAINSTVRGESNVEIPVNNSSWRKYTKINESEIGEKISLKLISRPSSQQKMRTKNLYDNVKIFSLKSLGSYSDNSKQNDYIESDNKGRNLSLDSVEGGYPNLIQNPSFEDGKWKPDVSDCNAYDNKPKLGMALSDSSTDGNRSIELRATRHIACTSPNILGVEENRDYLLSFDYMGYDAKKAGYSVSFNDSSKTFISKRLDIKNGDWATVNQTITVPRGATEARLTIYSYASDGTIESKNFYDNFLFTKIPSLQGQFLIVEKNKQKYSNPESVDFESLSPTRKTIKVSSATTPFYLAISEQYHEGWRAYAQTNTGEKVLIDTSNHLSMNNFQNAWFINVNKLCIENDVCKKTSNGSYDIDFIIDFKPQKNFTYGLWISITTLSIVIVYFIMSRKNVG